MGSGLELAPAGDDAVAGAFQVDRRGEAAFAPIVGRGRALDAAARAARLHVLNLPTVAVPRGRAGGHLNCVVVLRGAARVVILDFARQPKTWPGLR